MVVYLDVVILVNFIVNFFLLYITAQTLRVKVKFRYMILASIIGSSYVLTLIYPSLKILSALYFKLAVAVTLILIAFRRKNILFNLKATCIFVLYSMVLAGVCVFIQFNRNGDISDSIIVNFPYQWLLLSLMIVYMIIDRIVVYIKERKSLGSLIYNVDIILKNTHKTVRAFLDTGNELREPATNLPVIIVEKSIFNDINLENYDKFYIPYRVVNGQGGSLQGFKPEAVKIEFGKEITDREVIIAFCEEKLSQFSDYHALLSRGVI